MADYPEVQLQAAQEHSSNHRHEILNSDVCGCFYCLANFLPREIEEWVDENACAICPKCGLDAVIGDASVFNVTNQAFLKSMRDYWFMPPIQKVAEATA